MSYDLRNSLLLEHQLPLEFQDPLVYLRQLVRMAQQFGLLVSVEGVDVRGQFLEGCVYCDYLALESFLVGLGRNQICILLPQVGGLFNEKGDVLFYSRIGENRLSDDRCDRLNGDFADADSLFILDNRLLSSQNSGLEFLISTHQKQVIKNMLQMSQSSSLLNAPAFHIPVFQYSSIDFLYLFDIKIAKYSQHNTVICSILRYSRIDSKMGSPPQPHFNFQPQILNFKFTLAQMMQKHHDDDFFGINKKLYKKPAKEEFSFKSIADNVFLPCQPELLAPNDAYETVHLPKHNILEQSLRRQVQSIVFAQTFINQIVYDSKDPSPYTKDMDPGSYDLDMLPYYLPKSKEEDNILVFESRFECGNLRRVIQKSEYEYNLVLNTDFNTNGHTQWYFFSVANTRKNVEYRFNIINLLKPDSLYNVGMKPLIYSEKNALGKGLGWVREGGEICYYTNNMKRKYGGYYSSLSFTLRFQHDHDTVYIAHCYPYSYTRLQRYLKTLQNDPIKKHRFQRKFHCLTESGNNCDYLVIGDGSKQKKAIILTARVHPGETMSSYIIEYIIEFLLSNSSLARSLRDNFVFKIVPMLNIDGVIVGNYRCNLSGADLNRQYVQPSKKAHPTIYHTKMLIKATKAERELSLLCDIHGHNRKKNIFIYGCTARDGSKKEQIFPMLMKNNCPVFQFKDCSFEVQKDREGAARIALWKELNIINCFTLECSFCGSDFGKYEFYHFNPSIYKDIAHAFCQSLEDYHEPTQTKVKKAMEELENMARNPRMEESGKNSEDSDYSGDENEIVTKEKEGRESKQKRNESKEPRDKTNEKSMPPKKNMPPSLRPKKK